MGAVKQHWHDEICANAGDDFDYYQYLQAEAARAEGEYLDLINCLPDAHARSKDQQRQIDTALSAKIKTYYAARET